MIDVALIGFGAIGRTLARTLAQHAAEVRIVAVLLRPQGRRPVIAELPADAQIVDKIDDLIAARPQVVIECAGHLALREMGPRVLDAGIALLVASVGALADPAVEAMLRRAATQGGTRVLLPSGALGALDILAAARLAGLAHVTYESRKAPLAWKGTPAEAMIALADLTAPVMFFAGNAREAALRFPQNANVAAAVALAGAGFEATRVQLVADPAVTGNQHRIAAEGDFGRFEFSVIGRVLPDNPKTSMLAPMSLAKSLLNLRACVALA